MRFALLLLLGVSSIIVAARPIDPPPTTLPEFPTYAFHPSGPNPNLSVTSNYDAPSNPDQAVKFHQEQIDEHKYRLSACRSRVAYSRPKLDDTKLSDLERSRVEKDHRNNVTKAMLHAMHIEKHEELAKVAEERRRPAIVSTQEWEAWKKTQPELP
jgi:hypothetical protein